jgi:hypothetical protein
LAQEQGAHQGYHTGVDRARQGPLEMARLGIGPGWNYVEYGALNEDFATRGRRQVEQVEVLRKLWAEPVVDYAGHWPKQHLEELCRSRITDSTVFLGFSDTWGLARDPAEKFNQLVDTIKKSYPRIKTLVGSQNLTATKIRLD